MHIRPKPPTVKNPPDQFTGDVWFDVIASPQDENQRMVVGIVRFAPRRPHGLAQPRQWADPACHPRRRPHAGPRRRHHRSAGRPDGLYPTR